METKNKKTPTHELNKSIKKLHETVQTGNTFRRAFMLGLVRGVGTAIGATVVAGLLVLIFQKVTSSAEDIPVINNFIHQEQQVPATESIDQPQ